VKPFPRRFYHRSTDLFRDLREIWRERRRIRAVTKGEGIDPALRERLMLAVTEVNGCRYCRYAHSRMALTAGLSEVELKELAAGNFQGSPPEQVPALLYAQHWAETDARPDAEARRRVVETYGSGQTEAIELTLRAIRVGNLLGNTWDCLLYRVSFGRWGNVKSEAAAGPA
jgi:AhpD family alkylhydroperoxidase